MPYLRPLPVSDGESLEPPMAEYDSIAQLIFQIAQTMFNIWLPDVRVCQSLESGLWGKVSKEVAVLAHWSLVVQEWADLRIDGQLQRVDGSSVIGA